MVHSAGYRGCTTGGVRLYGVDGRASGVYLKTDLRTSVTFSQIPVSYGAAVVKPCPTALQW